MKVQVIGLGKLGCPLAAVLASKGHEVIGVDASPVVVNLVNDRVAPVAEPGLEELLRQYPFHAVETDLIGWATARADATFVIVPTPTDETGGFSNDYVIDVVRAVGKGLMKRSGGRYHLLVVCSTVLPGSMEEIIDAFTDTSACHVGRDVGVCYSPEFIAIGSVIQDMLQPDMVLVGESDKKAGEMLAAFWATITDSPVVRLNLINAEVAKIAVNAYVTMKISFANTLAELCERYPGADATAVADAIGLDSRIGRRYLRPAGPFGGPCFPRDSEAIVGVGKKMGVPMPLVEATKETNDYQARRLAQRALLNLKPTDTFGVAGLSFKPGTPIIERSLGIDVARDLAERGISVAVHDPMAMDEARKLLGDTVIFSPTVPDTDVLLIATAWDEYRGLTPRKGQLIMDCWGVAKEARGGTVWRVGKG